jgi:hypothetical protein
LFLASAVAAALLLLVLPPLLWMDRGRPASAILNEKESLAMELEQEEVVQELLRMEPVFREKAGEVRRDRNLLNRIDRLDQNIERCCSLYENNSLNRGVREALLACFRMKLEIMKRYLLRKEP